MSPNRFSLCLFDLGKVIVDFDFQIAARRLSPLCNLSPRDVLQQMASWETLILFEEGKIKPFPFFEAMKEFLRCSLTYEEFLPIWNEIFTEDKEVSALVRKMLGRVPLALISNTDLLHFNYCYQTFPIVREVGQFILSYEVGYRKPDPRIYQAALSRFKTPAEKTIYVDDLSTLILAGKSLGLEAILFRGAERLEKALSERGVL